MLCKCGKKVDRREPHKVQCLLCNQFCHASCYQITNNDIELIKFNFKCETCLSSRRRSLSTSSMRLVNKNNDVHIVCEKDVNVPKVVGTKNSDKPFTAVSALNAQSSKNLSSAATMNNVVVAKNSTPSYGVFINNVHNKLDHILDELVSLRGSNNSLTKEISLMRAENIAFKQSNISLSEQVFLLSADNAILKDKVNELVHVIQLSNNKDLISNNREIKTSWAKIIAETGKPIDARMKKPVSDSLRSSEPMLACTDTDKTIDALVKTPISNSLRSSDSLIGSAPNTSSSMRSPVLASNNTNFPSVTLIDKVPAINNVANSSISPALNSPAFKVVTKKKNRQNKKDVVVGSNENTELDVVAHKKWLHLSTFKPSVTEDDIINYVHNKSGIDVKFLACNKLIKIDAEIQTLRKINFRLGVTDAHYDKLLNPNLWPVDVKVRPFRFRQKVANKV